MSDPISTIDASGLLAKADQLMSAAEDTHRAEMQAQLRTLAAADGAHQHAPQGALPMPPGFVGALAQFVYQSAPRPVPEVAIVAALGIMAGLAGREWTTFTNSGLNLYLVLVARSAIGKEAMHTGTATVMRAMEEQYPEARYAFNFTEFASGPALLKGIALTPCLLNIMGEIGHKFLAMSKGKDTAVNSLRKTLTDLYNKSGANGIVGGLSYSSQDNNVLSVDSVAYSLMGETTPGTFYQSITEEMMADGFMSRFCVIEYTGERPPENPAPQQYPSRELVNWLLTIALQSSSLRRQGLFCPVQPHADAKEVLAAFNLECDHNIRLAGDDERLRQLWSRAHLKVLRVSALLAVGDNPIQPMVSLAHVRWAIGLIRHGIAPFDRRIRTGEVGEGTDSGREQKVLDLCREFLTLPAGDKKLAEFKGAAEMQQAGIVPRKYLQKRTQRLSAFEKHPLGHTAALNMTLKTAVTNGNLIEVKKDRLVEMFDFHGQAYRWICPS